MRVVRTRRGARLVEGEVILSEIRSDPGPTHTLFDVLAACTAALAPGPRVALLGFAGGGMVAPLRAMGCDAPLRAVDLDPEGVALFRELSGPWAGEVEVARGDAVDWLRATRRRFDLVVEDLSTPSPVGTIKPYVSYDPLPGLIRDRLRPGGLALTNLLPLPGTAWASQTAHVSHPHRNAVELRLTEYENRFVIAGDVLPAAATIARRVGKALRAIGSNQVGKLAARTLFRG